MNAAAKRHSLRRRVLVGYGIAAVLTGLVLAWGLVSLMRLGAVSDAMLRDNYRSILAAEKMRDAIQGLENATVLLLVRSDQRVIERVTGAQQQFLLNLAKAKDNITVPGEAEIVAGIEQEYNKYVLDMTRFLESYRTDSSEGLTFYREHLHPSVVGIQEGCSRLLELNQATMGAESERARRVAGAAVWSVIVVGAAAVLLTVTLSFLLSASILRSVRQLMQATEEVASGNYGVQVHCRSNDEFLTLTEHFNRMVKKLRVFDELRVGEIIAEKKKNETILATMDDGVLVVDANRTITSLNPAAARALGLRQGPGETVDLSALAPKENLLRDIEEALRTGRGTTDDRDDRYLTACREGEESHYEYSITLVREPRGKLVGVVVLLRDVTRLKELDRLKSQFVMTASHELRTPLTSVEMSVGLLRERALEKLDPSERELLDVAHEEVVRLKHLVNDLLDLTKIETGKIVMDFAEVAPRVLLENAVEPLRAQAAKLSLHLALDVRQGLPNALVDATKITWVVTNLVGNALRYTRPGGHVWVSADRAGDWLHLYVRDDGVGIPHEKQAEIFNEFVQLEGSGPPGGAGLGLAISRQIVRAHRGQIWVESEPGKGSLFTVALPLRPAVG